MAAVGGDPGGAVGFAESQGVLEAAFDDIEVSTPAPDGAIVAYTVRQTVRMDGRRQALHAADSSTWIRGADGRRRHAHSETFLQA